jgi:flagellar protein FlgJ
MDVSNILPMSPPTMEADPQALANQLKSSGGHSVDAVATNFESMFLSMMLKEMRQTLDKGGFFGEDTGDVYGGLFDLYLGQHLAEAGGIGIAPLIRRQLEIKQKP